MMLKRWSALVLSAMLFIGCAPAQAAPQYSVEEYPRVDGSTATLPLSYALMQRICGVEEEEAKIAITHTKTTESFYALVDGAADLLLVYAPEQSALDYADEMGVELLMQPITRDALVFLVNAGNPVASLSQEEAVGIYSGEILNWKEVGGEDKPIVAYQRVESSGSQVMMRSQVMKGAKMADAPTELRPGEMGELIDRVASYKNTANAIGYSVYYYAHNMYVQDGIRLLCIDEVAPSNQTIASGEYPYCQDVYAVIRADEPQDSPARILFDYLQTEEGMDLIETAGYVRLTASQAEKSTR